MAYKTHTEQVAIVRVDRASMHWFYGTNDLGDSRYIEIQNYDDDNLYQIGGNELVLAKAQGIRFAIVIDVQNFEPTHPTDTELLHWSVTHERLMEFVAANDVIEEPLVDSNSHGTWMFVNIRFGKMIYTFYGLGARDVDGKVIREKWAFFSRSPRDKDVVCNHGTAMQKIIERRREVDLWDDPPMERTRDYDALLDACGDDEDAALTMHEDMNDD